MRFLLYTGKKSSSSGSSPGPQTSSLPREGWARRESRPQSRRSASGQRVYADCISSVMTQLGYLCVRHVIQHCGAYLLDLLSPPAAPSLGKTSLMVIKEAVLNGEVGRCEDVFVRCFVVSTSCNPIFVSYCMVYEPQPSTHHNVQWGYMKYQGLLFGSNTAFLSCRIQLFNSILQIEVWCLNQLNSADGLNPTISVALCGRSTTFIQTPNSCRAECKAWITVIYAKQKITKLPTP